MVPSALHVWLLLDHISYFMCSSFSSPRASCLLLRADGWGKAHCSDLSSHKGQASFILWIWFLPYLPPICWASWRDLLSILGGRIHFLGKLFLLVSYYLRTHCNLLYSPTDENFSLSAAGSFEMAESLLSKAKSSRHINFNYWLEWALTAQTSVYFSCCLNWLWPIPAHFALVFPQFSITSGWQEQAEEHDVSQLWGCFWNNFLWSLQGKPIKQNKHSLYPHILKQHQCCPGKSSSVLASTSKCQSCCHQRCKDKNHHQLAV